jgi:hypothetical protein
VSGGASAAPPPQTTAPASWRLTYIALGITWGGGAGWWVTGATGRANCALRVLGSPSALRTKEPTRTGGPPATGGAGRSPRTRFFFCESPLKIHI